ncbi:Flagellar hook-associated protein 3 [Candidatus Methylobacter favarea]|uniref:Flagellar hook-associated protein 3 n=1 Tax=Candidatus Methylobacter favarea TaxID=2707345 RepID=A0A8S0YAW7_9GAMM|nr:flagellar hook-associated protein FlgL [Candidatus Methylobacter favarea]CAA9892697.1 Flagellar hook-associated protein 3 [Candidatus Methylobacter favarea]
MRISTSWAQQLGVNSLLDQQSKVSELQMQLSAQEKILKPSDDPAAAARIIDLDQGIKQTEQYQSNINAARQRLSLEDGILQDAVNVLQRVKELGIQGLNDTNSPSDRTAIAVELEGLSDHLAGLANTRNANGEYLFSGFKSDTQPFSKDTDTPPLHVGAYIYSGDSNQRNIQIGTDRQISDGDYGINVFGAPTGPLPATVPAPGSITNIFEAIGKLAADLRSNAPDSASLDDISSSLDRMLTTQSSVGVRLNALDRQEDLNSASVLELKTVLSQTEDLDFTEAISKFNLQTVSLQAAQQAFSRVQNLSLFNYL